MTGGVIEVPVAGPAVLRTALTFKQAQEYVGGFVEVLTLASGEALLVNEEGALLGLPYNHAATRLYGAYVYGPALRLVGESVVNDVLDGDGYNAAPP